MQFREVPHGRAQRCAVVVFLGVDVASPTFLGMLNQVLFTTPPPSNLSANRFINQQRFGPDGTAPYPNSRHIGIVIMSFCDGTVKPIDQNVDSSVYVRLITPSGARHRGGVALFVPEVPLAGNDF